MQQKIKITVTEYRRYIHMVYRRFYKETGSEARAYNMTLTLFLGILCRVRQHPERDPVALWIEDCMDVFCRAQNSRGKPAAIKNSEESVGKVGGNIDPSVFLL